MKCVACLQGDSHECRAEGNCGIEVVDGLESLGHSDVSGSLVPGPVDLRSDSELLSLDASDGEEEEKETPEFRTYKDDSALRDQQSTGRKRAAKMYPLDAEAACEWRMRKNCGGGKLPIVGCLKGLQEARHHGPDKNTLNNEAGNVHRICHFCHNRWHTLNDPDYVWSANYDQHDPTSATIIDIVENEDFWAGRETVKAKD
jgi:hypothetical protein